MARTQGEPEIGGPKQQKVAAWGDLTQVTTPWGYRAGEELPGYPSCIRHPASADCLNGVVYRPIP